VVRILTEPQSALPAGSSLAFDQSEGEMYDRRLDRFDVNSSPLAFLAAHVVNEFRDGTYGIDAG
jgi:hypothetical protein